MEVTQRDFLQVAAFSGGSVSHPIAAGVPNIHMLKNESQIPVLVAFGGGAYGG